MCNCDNDCAFASHVRLMLCLLLAAAAQFSSFIYVLLLELFVVGHRAQFQLNFEQKFVFLFFLAANLFFDCSAACVRLRYEFR